ncbi:MAG: tetraacyldisaccharide 4'-kinase [Candidatus Puniceispirillaceae bacterium]
MKAPAFWEHKGLVSTLLLPASWLYFCASYLRQMLHKPYQASLPVICIGNITSGGTGKTPTTAFIAHMMEKSGKRPVILSRGYGGQIHGPIMVDHNSHKAKDCGDEPLLLAKSFPVVIARNREKGARFIESLQKYDAIIMDDGMQNPQLAKDLIICVFDGNIGLQNQRLFPSGPLRESLGTALPDIDLAIINGRDHTNLTPKMGAVPVITAALEAKTPPATSQDSDALWAFAGIGQPERFFSTLRKMNCHLAGSTAFGDHHNYREDELVVLDIKARQHNARLITTEKDWVRLSPDWQKKIAYLPVSLHISKPDIALLQSILSTSSTSSTKAL